MTFDEINASSRYSPLVQQKTSNQDIKSSKDETFASTLDSFVTERRILFKKTVPK